MLGLHGSLLLCHASSFVIRFLVLGILLSYRCNRLRRQSCRLVSVPFSCGSQARFRVLFSPLFYFRHATAFSGFFRRTAMRVIVSRCFRTADLETNAHHRFLLACPKRIVDVRSFVSGADGFHMQCGWLLAHDAVRSVRTVCLGVFELFVLDVWSIFFFFFFFCVCEINKQNAFFLIK